jgi:hypothetical protein
MNKLDYLNQGVVADFVTYLVDKLDGSKFSHSYAVRDRRIPVGYAGFDSPSLIKIDSLEDAFNKYWWNRDGFEKNDNKLQEISLIIRSAIEKECSEAANEICRNAIHEVLKWGAGGTGQSLYTSNMDWADAQSHKLVERIQTGRKVMSSQIPDVSIFSKENGPRMNAGFTKYYALACDDVVIYDGRVGAALGMLVRDFCTIENLDEIPAELAFRWGAQYSKDPARALNRNPSNGKYIFPRLPAGGAIWAECNIKANWILKSAKDRVTSEWCGASDGMRKIEASLFTLGYSIPER